MTRRTALLAPPPWASPTLAALDRAKDITSMLDVAHGIRVMLARLDDGGRTTQLRMLASRMHHAWLAHRTRRTTR